ncbi:MAG: thiamine biosynthesis lipoprotein [Polaribacter sp.]|jgi:thiamine biosynthesis lipoprotein
MRPIFLFLLLTSTALLTAQDTNLVSQKKVLKLMGSRFELTAVAENEHLAWAAINGGIKEIERIENLISSWDKNSQTSAINRNAGIRPVKVDEELYDLIFRATKVSNLTEGAFDISFASMDRIWKFDGSMQQMPEIETIEKARAKIDYQNIILDKETQTVFLKEEGMKIGFGAIGKGYAANRAKALMQKMTGIKGGVVNASGDLITWGLSNTPEGWVVNITNPKDKEVSLGWIQINDLSVVTSGDYERFVEFDGKRYAHIINPLTGYPTTGIKSVTLICPDAELADALATSIFVLGKEKGLKLVNLLQQTECLIITDEDEILISENLKFNYF